MDSGASNHVIGDYNNLINPKEYGGNEQVTIGNGDKLPITYTGSSYLSDGINTLTLENILFVPDIAKNLVSVSKLAQDNNIYFEFHGDFCLVKNKASGQVVLKGVLRDGLYHLESVNTSPGKEELAAFGPQPSRNNSYGSSVMFSVSHLPIVVNVTVSKNVWHQRLGHPASKVLDSIIKTCNLLINDNEVLSFCESYQFGKSHGLSFSPSPSRVEQCFDLGHFFLLIL